MGPISCPRTRPGSEIRGSLNGIRWAAVRGAKSWTAANYFPAQIRRDRVCTSCAVAAARFRAKPSRALSPAGGIVRRGRRFGADDRRTARSDRAPERPEAPPEHQTERHEQGHHAGETAPGGEVARSRQDHASGHSLSSTLSGRLPPVRSARASLPAPGPRTPHRGRPTPSRPMKEPCPPRAETARSYGVRSAAK